MINQRTATILIIVSAVFLLFSISIIMELPVAIAQTVKKSGSISDSTTQSRLALINSAVRAVPRKLFFEYTAGFENPFKSWQPRQRKSRSNVKVSRVKLTLKGILIKKKPLAILEDSMGKTYIRGVDEKAIDQVVVKISENSVTLRDHAGTYELTVEDY